MKRKIIFGLICGLVLTTNVNAEEISADFNKIAPNGTLRMNAVKPTARKTEDGIDMIPELDFYPNMYVQKLLPEAEYNGYLDSCNEDLTECTLNLISYENYEESYKESHAVKVVWETPNPEYQKIIETYKTKLEDKNKETNYNHSYAITDLDLINYKSSEKFKTTSGGNLVANYASSLKKEFAGTKITYQIDTRMGDGLIFNGGCGGGLILYYDNVMYALVDSIRINNKNVVYIPDETENTSEAFIAAATKRISDYLGNNDFKIEVGGKISEYTNEFGETEDFTALGTADSMGDYYYKITFKNGEDLFVFVKDSSKIETPKVETKDETTNITINTTSPDVPHDTIVKVESITKETPVYNKIVEVLKIENFKAFDISLYSTAKGNITKLTNGLFEVIIPIGKEYVGKTMAAYYIKEDNTIEIHDVIMDEQGNAKFTTNHFSTYILAEKKEVEDAITEEVPKTSDNINTYFILGGIGLISLISLGFTLKKKEN